VAIVVAVAGAHEIVESGLRQILESAPDLEILESFPHFGIIPDVVVYDVVAVLGDDDGAELFRVVDEHASAVVVVGRDLRPDLAARAMARGADACISIEAEATEILSVIRAAATGDLDGREPFAPPPELGHEASLTPREVNVVQGIVAGLSNQEIAEREALSPNTIKSYIRGAYRRMGVQTRSQAVSWGLQHGFASTDADAAQA
jgi:DNA-binding NarL/FixJ family response regulator